jgi:regulator of replication initiation timing
MTTYTIGGGGESGMKYPDITVEELDNKIENLLKQNEDLKHEIEILVEALRDLQWKLDGLSK